MEEYDIRDALELHNLLKKIVDPKTCQDIGFLRQPIIRFGTFDRNQAISEIIEILSPITTEELAEYLYSEYGYSKETVASSAITTHKRYYHRGVFTVDFKQIPENRIDLLRAHLTEDFYYISEIKSI